MENTSKNTIQPSITFVKGNYIVAPKVLEYANRYQTFLNKTAESILSLTETVYEAKKNLSDDDFKVFKMEVGLKSKATVSKFIAIGEKVSRLEPYKNNLPCSWTTLYKLVRLEQSDFDQVKDFLFSDMTASDIGGLLGNASQKNKFVDRPDIKIYFNTSTEYEKKRFAIKLHALLKQYKVNACFPVALSEKNCNPTISNAA